MSALPFEYAVLRIVPRVDRGEFVNGAVLVYCQKADFLGIRVREDLSSAAALWPDLDVETVREALDSVAVVVSGGDGAGGAARETAGRRFRWLTAPRSVVVQPGPVHTGVTQDPAGELERIADAMLG